MSVLPLLRRSELEAVSEGCLHRYKAIWIDGVDDTSDYALRGIAFHAIKHRYILALVEQQLSQDFELAQQAFVQGIAGCQTPTHLLPEIRQLWAFHAERFELELERFVTAEEKQPSGGVVFTPDLVLAYPERNELEITDDKTFFRALTEAEARQSFQARFYTRHAMARWPNFTSYRFTFDFVRFHKRVSVTFTPDDLDVLDREVAAAVATIEAARISGSWPAVAGPACTYCTLRCPLADEALIVPKRFTELEQVEKVAAWLLAAETMVKAGKKALKAWCVVNGPVDVNGVQWANRPITQRSYPLDDVVQILHAAGLMGALEDETISASALAKVIKKYPALVEQLNVLERQETIWRFTAAKPHAESEEDE